MISIGNGGYSVLPKYRSNNEVAIVTGGNGSIGYETSKALAVTNIPPLPPVTMAILY